MKTLQEKLRLSGQWHSVQNDYFQDGALMVEAAERIDALENLFRWVPIEERNPEPQVNVFASDTNGHVSVCSWWGGDYKFDMTHWMEIPKVP